jgi:integrase/recombinase XerD
MTTEKDRLTWTVTEWPIADQALWRAATEAVGPFGKKNPAISWSVARRHIVEDGYGQWLAWLSTKGWLDPALRPGLRVTPERVRCYGDNIGARLAPVSVAMMIGSLARMMVALEPTFDWAWLRAVYQHLKTTAPPSRDKRNAVVPAKDLYDLGLRLMQDAEARTTRSYLGATQFRDGLMIALLAALPVRMANFSRIELGQHLVERGAEYWLVFSAEETKNGRHIEAPLPDHIVPNLVHYLRVHRLALLSLRKNQLLPTPRALWINRLGQMMGEGAIREQIKQRTKAAFGHEIWPHLFRDCVATSIAIEKPDIVAIAADILGHASFATTDKYYNQARAIEASRMYQRCIAKLRSSDSAKQASGDLPISLIEEDP